jgi:Ca2+-transporting ATPase
MSEVVSIFIATLFGFVILHPVHLLWINLITDSFPALALGMEKGEANLMKRKPRSAKSGIFSEGLGFDVLYQGLLVAALTLTAYFTGNYIETGVWEIAESKDGITMAFLTLSFAEIFHSFNMRSQRTSIFKIRKQNLFLWGAGVASLILTTLVIYVPFLAKAFEFEHISAKEYIIAVLIAACVIPIVEIVKLIQRTVEKRKQS